MIDPLNAVFCFNMNGDARILPVGDPSRSRYRSAFGAEFRRWGKMNRQEALQVLVYLALDGIRQYGLNPDKVFAEIQKVEGMNDYLYRLEKIGCLCPF